MTVPDKIYLTPRINDEASLCALWFHKKQVGENIEYLRKDTLLEWAKGLEADSARRAGDNDAACGYRDAIMDLIDKLNSL